MRRKAASIAVALTVSTIAWACNAYDPDLGSRPFRCGDQSPRCPDGYECVVFGPGEELCEAGAAATVDGGNFACLDDTDIEPNDDLARAFPSGIPTNGTSFSLVGVAICPASDVDLFVFTVDMTGKNLTADINFNSAQGGLILEVLNSGGTTIRTGTAVAGDSDTVRAEVPNMPPGNYYVQVRAESGAENNYNVSLILN